MNNNGQNYNYGYNNENNGQYGYTAVAEPTQGPNYHYSNGRVGFELVKSVIYTESLEQIF